MTDILLVKDGLMMKIIPKSDEGIRWILRNMGIPKYSAHFKISLEFIEDWKKHPRSEGLIVDED
jgi:hypothetical protein